MGRYWYQAEWSKVIAKSQTFHQPCIVYRLTYHRLVFAKLDYTLLPLPLACPPVDSLQRQLSLVLSNLPVEIQPSPWASKSASISDYKVH